MTRILLWQKVSKLGGLKKSPYEGDAGVDMVVSVRTTIYSAEPEPTKVPMGIRIALPKDMAALVIGRSSVAREGIAVVPTVIDQGFRGHIYALVYLINPRKGHCKIIKAGERIAQLLLIPCLGDGLVLKEVKHLPESERGIRGWGSSGG